MTWFQGHPQAQFKAVTHVGHTVSGVISPNLAYPPSVVRTPQQPFVTTSSESCSEGGLESQISRGTNHQRLALAAEVAASSWVGTHCRSITVSDSSAQTDHGQALDLTLTCGKSEEESPSDGTPRILTKVLSDSGAQVLAPTTSPQV